MHRTTLRFRCIAVLLFSTCFSIVAQETLTGPEVIGRSIGFHDPDSLWPTQPFSFRLFESRPGVAPEDGGNYRITDVTFDIPSARFELLQQRGPDYLSRRVLADSCIHTLNGAPPDTSAIRKLRLTCAYTLRMRDYYTYLWGLPMKLRDPGTIVHDPVERVDFFGQLLLQVKVSYDEAVGSDTWYFYFHPVTYALSGYRFYHDEEANDGEYVLLSGLANVDGLLLPGTRRWYTHGDQRFLGEDRIIFNK